MNPLLEIINKSLDGLKLIVQWWRKRKKKREIKKRFKAWSKQNEYWRKYYSD